MMSNENTALMPIEEKEVDFYNDTSAAGAPWYSHMRPDTRTLFGLGCYTLLTETGKNQN